MDKRKNDGNEINVLKYSKVYLVSPSCDSQYIGLEPYQTT